MENMLKAVSDGGSSILPYLSVADLDPFWPALSCNMKSNMYVLTNEAVSSVVFYRSHV